MVHTNRRLWTLKVRSVVPSDSGGYECQVNTETDASRRFFNVTVIEASLRLSSAGEEADELGADEPVYLNVGSTLKLDCRAETGPILRPQYLMWSRDGHIVEYASDIDAVVETDGDGRRSRLVIGGVGEGDSGRYTCATDLTREASVHVYVVKEDLKSLSQDSKAAAVANVASSDKAGIETIAILVWVTTMALVRSR